LIEVEKTIIQFLVGVAEGEEILYDAPLI